MAKHLISSPVRPCPHKKFGERISLFLPPPGAENPSYVTASRLIPSSLCEMQQSASPTGILQFVPVKNTARHSLCFANYYNQKRYFHSKWIKSVWRRGSTWAHRGSLQGSPDPLAEFQGTASWQGRTGKGGQERDRSGQRKREEGSSAKHRCLDPPLMSHYECF